MDDKMNLDSIIGMGLEAVISENMHVIDNYASFLPMSDEKYRKIKEKLFNMEVMRYEKSFIEQILSDNDNLRKSREKLLELCRPLAQQNREYSKQLETLKRQCDNANRMCVAWKHSKDEMYLLYKNTERELEEKTKKLEIMERSLTQLRRLKNRKKKHKFDSTKNQEISSDAVDVSNSSYSKNAVTSELNSTNSLLKGSSPVSNNQNQCSTISEDEISSDEETSQTKPSRINSQIDCVGDTVASSSTTVKEGSKIPTSSNGATNLASPISTATKTKSKKNNVTSPKDKSSDHSISWDRKLENDRSSTNASDHNFNCLNDNNFDPVFDSVDDFNDFIDDSPPRINSPPLRVIVSPEPPNPAVVNLGKNKFQAPFIPPSTSPQIQPPITLHPSKMKSPFKSPGSSKSSPVLNKKSLSKKLSPPAVGRELRSKSRLSELNRGKASSKESDLVPLVRRGLRSRYSRVSESNKDEESCNASDLMLLVGRDSRSRSMRLSESSKDEESCEESDSVPPVGKDSRSRSRSSELSIEEKSCKESNLMPPVGRDLKSRPKRLSESSKDEESCEESDSVSPVGKEPRSRSRRSSEKSKEEKSCKESNLVPPVGRDLKSRPKRLSESSKDEESCEESDSVPLVEKDTRSRSRRSSEMSKEEKSCKESNLVLPVGRDLRSRSKRLSESSKDEKPDKKSKKLAQKDTSRKIINCDTKLRIDKDKVFSTIFDDLDVSDSASSIGDDDSPPSPFSVISSQLPEKESQLKSDATNVSNKDSSLLTNLSYKEKSPEIKLIPTKSSQKGIKIKASLDKGRPLIKVAETRLDIELEELKKKTKRNRISRKLKSETIETDLPSEVSESVELLCPVLNEVDFFDAGSLKNGIFAINLDLQGLSVSTPPDDASLSNVGSPDYVTPPLSPISSMDASPSPSISTILLKSKLIRPCSPCSSEGDDAMTFFPSPRVVYSETSPNDSVNSSLLEGIIKNTTAPMNSATSPPKEFSKDTMVVDNKTLLSQSEGRKDLIIPCNAIIFPPPKRIIEDLTAPDYIVQSSLLKENAVAPTNSTAPLSSERIMKDLTTLNNIAFLPSHELTTKDLSCEEIEKNAMAPDSSEVSLSEEISKPAVAPDNTEVFTSSEGISENTTAPDNSGIFFSSKEIFKDVTAPDNTEEISKDAAAPDNMVVFSSSEEISKGSTAPDNTGVIFSSEEIFKDATAPDHTEEICKDAAAPDNTVVFSSSEEISKGSMAPDNTEILSSDVEISKGAMAPDDTGVLSSCEEIPEDSTASENTDVFSSLVEISKDSTSSDNTGILFSSEEISENATASDNTEEISENATASDNTEEISEVATAPDNTEVFSSLVEISKDSTASDNTGILFSSESISKDTTTPDNTEVFCSSEEISEDAAAPNNSRVLFSSKEISENEMDPDRITVSSQNVIALVSPVISSLSVEIKKETMAPDNAVVSSSSIEITKDLATIDKPISPCIETSKDLITDENPAILCSLEEISKDTMFSHKALILAPSEVVNKSIAPELEETPSSILGASCVSVLKTHFIDEIEEESIPISVADGMDDSFVDQEVVENLQNSDSDVEELILCLVREEFLRIRPVSPLLDCIIKENGIRPVSPLLDIVTKINEIRSASPLNCNVLIEDEISLASSSLDSVTEENKIRPGSPLLDNVIKENEITPVSFMLDNVIKENEITPVSSMLDSVVKEDVIRPVPLLPRIVTRKSKIKPLPSVLNNLTMRKRTRCVLPSSANNRNELRSAESTVLNHAEECESRLLPSSLDNVTKENEIRPPSPCLDNINKENPSLLESVLKGNGIRPVPVSPDIVSKESISKPVPSLSDSFTKRKRISRVRPPSDHVTKENGKIRPSSPFLDNDTDNDRVRPMSPSRDGVLEENGTIPIFPSSDNIIKDEEIKPTPMLDKVNDTRPSSSVSDNVSKEVLDLDFNLKEGKSETKINNENIESPVNTLAQDLRSNFKTLLDYKIFKNTFNSKKCDFVPSIQKNEVIESKKAETANPKEPARRNGLKSKSVTQESSAKNCSKSCVTAATRTKPNPSMVTDSEMVALPKALGPRTSGRSGVQQNHVNSQPSKDKKLCSDSRDNSSILSKLSTTGPVSVNHSEASSKHSKTATSSSASSEKHSVPSKNSTSVSTLFSVRSSVDDAIDSVLRESSAEISQPENSVTQNNLSHSEFVSTECILNDALMKGSKRKQSNFDVSNGSEDVEPPRDLDGNSLTIPKHPRLHSSPSRNCKSNLSQKSTAAPVKVCTNLNSSLSCLKNNASKPESHAEKTSTQTLNGRMALNKDNFSKQKLLTISCDNTPGNDSNITGQKIDQCDPSSIECSEMKPNFKVDEPPKYYESESNCLWTCFRYYKDVHCKKVVEDHQRSKRNLKTNFHSLGKYAVRQHLLELINPSLETWSELAATKVLRLENTGEAIIIDSILEIIGNDDSELDTVVHPALRTTQQLFLVFCHKVAALRPSFMDLILMAIEKILFCAEGHQKASQIENLSIFFTIICRSLNRIDRCRMFIYDTFYMTVFKGHLVVYSILSVWPQVFPLASKSEKCPQSMVIAYEIFKTVRTAPKDRKFNSNSDDFKIAALKNLLCQFYGYTNSSSAQIKMDKILSDLSSMLDYSGCVEAYVLLAKREDWQWTAKNLVFNHLIPLLQNFKITKNNEAKAIKVVQIVGLVTRAFPVGVAWLETKRIIEYLETLLIDVNLGSASFKEAVAISIIQLSRLDCNLCFSILAKWNPPSKSLSVKFLEEVKTMFYNKPLSCWNNQLKSKYLNAPLG